jgi:DNA-binding SARP family transcriptional activator
VLQVQLIGALTLAVDGTAVPLPSSGRARALLAWLALHPGAQPRAAVAAQFWPDVLDSSARSSLRTTLRTLRQELGDTAAGYLVATRDDVGLERVSTDLQRLDELLSEGEDARRSSSVCAVSSSPGSRTSGFMRCATSIANACWPR